MPGEAFGQAAPPRPAFEIASIRVHEGAPQWKLAINGTRLTIESYTLFGLIQEAYDLQNYQIPETGTPPLLSSSTILYDISAKAESQTAPSRSEYRQMLQSLLADRFQLKVHREMKEMPVFALQVGKDGPKFGMSSPDADPQTHIPIAGSNYRATMARTTLDDLAKTILTKVSGRPVLDRTGLTGTYNITLTYKPESQMSRGPEPDTSEISIFTAVEDQLGLRLEPRNEKVEVLVVDHVEKPSDN